MHALEDLDLPDSAAKAHSRILRRFFGAPEQHCTRLQEQCWNRGRRATCSAMGGRSASSQQGYSVQSANAAMQSTAGEATLRHMIFADGGKSYVGGCA